MICQIVLILAQNRSTYKGALHTGIFVRQESQEPSIASLSDETILTTEKQLILELNGLGSFLGITIEPSANMLSKLIRSNLTSTVVPPIQSMPNISVQRKLMEPKESLLPGDYSQTNSLDELALMYKAKAKEIENKKPSLRKVGKTVDSTADIAKSSAVLAFLLNFILNVDVFDYLGVDFNYKFWHLIVFVIILDTIQEKVKSLGDNTAEFKENAKEFANYLNDLAIEDAIYVLRKIGSKNKRDVLSANKELSGKIKTEKQTTTLRPRRLS